MNGEKQFSNEKKNNDEKNGPGINIIYLEFMGAVAKTFFNMLNTVS